MSNDFVVKVGFNAEERGEAAVNLQGWATLIESELKLGKTPEISIKGTGANSLAILKSENNPGSLRLDCSICKDAKFFGRLTTAPMDVAQPVMETGENWHLTAVPYDDPKRLRVGYVVGATCDSLTVTSAITVSIATGEAEVEVSVIDEDVEDTCGDVDWALSNIGEAERLQLSPECLNELTCLFKMARSEDFKWGIVTSEDDTMQILVATDGTSTVSVVVNEERKEPSFPPIDRKEVPLAEYPVSKSRYETSMEAKKKIRREHGLDAKPENPIDRKVVPIRAIRQAVLLKYSAESLPEDTTGENSSCL